ncbi:MAG: hypothetical protein KKI15_07705 [Proteobacteria bacterium]|nr:hypothetical protein [Pseudomonadota bacterium]
MNDTTSDILLLVTPTAVLLLFWIIIRIKNSPKWSFSLVWLVNVLVMATIGLITHKEGVTESSRLASIVMFPSTVFLNGPLLISCLKKKVNKFWLFLFTIILAPLSFAVVAIIMLFTGNIYI